jgi:hypothetical protein
MDANKLLEILLLIEADEKDFTFGDKIQEIRGLIAQNNDAAGQQASEKLEILLGDIQKSRAANFAVTEDELLKQLKALEFFGLGLFDQLQRVSSARGFEVSAKFNAFQSGRAEKLKKLMHLKNALVDIGITAYKQEQPEIALTIPEDLLEIDSVAKYLEKFGDFLNAVQEALPGEAADHKPIKIVRLNKGSGQFFLGVDPLVAQAVLGILSDLATVYLAARELRKPDKKNEKLSEEEQLQVEKVYDDILRQRLEKFIDTTPERVAAGAGAEQKQRIKTYLKFLVKWLPLGINVEVVFTKSIEPMTTEQAQDAGQRQLQTSRTRDIYRLPREQLKLPEPENGDDVDKGSPTKKKKATE